MALTTTTIVNIDQNKVKEKLDIVHSFTQRKY